MTDTRRWKQVLGLVTALAMLASPLGAQAASSVAGGRFLVTATTGGGTAAPVVLLRWSAVDRTSPYDSFLVRRRAAPDAIFQEVALVEEISDPAEIESVFPSGSSIRAEVESMIVPALGPTLGEALVALRTRSDPARAMQYRMLLDTNYGAAIAQGLAYLDASVVDGTRYLYELWGLDAQSLPVERLGKVWALAGTDTVLPAPVALVAVRLADEDNPPTGNFPGAEDLDLDDDGRLDSAAFADGKVYLSWDPTPGQLPDRETQPAGFGFDVLRVPKGGGACPASPPQTGTTQVNRYPVLPEGTPDTDIGGFFFVDDGTNPASPPPVKGMSYCYWLAARDLLGQRGAWSAPLEACAPDLAAPRQVFGVETAVVGGQVEVRWAANADDPPAPEGGTGYTDDTTAYNVYRFTDFTALAAGAGNPDPSGRVASALPQGTTSWIDATPGNPSEHVGRIYWYVVTATDAGVCGRPANESHPSSPARAVVYDMTPPVITSVEPWCDTTAHPGCLRDCGGSGPPDPWCQAGGVSGLFPSAGDPWGFRVPAGGTDSTDVFSVRLFRGMGASDFEPVEEAFFSAADGGWLARETSLMPRISQKLEYRLRAIDRDSNVGPVAQPLDAGGRPFPVFLKGEPPLPPTILRVEPDTPGTVKVRWHAPGADALAGFIIRIGPPGRPDVGTFVHLPAGNLWAETSLDGSFLPRDTDGDGESPYDIVLRETTAYLADLPARGGLDAGGDYMEATVPEPAAGEIVEMYGVDIAGQVSAATEAPLDLGVSGPRPRWPERDLRPSFDLDAAFVEGGAGADHVDLCWDRGNDGRCVNSGETCSSDLQCPGSSCDLTKSVAPWVAVFRTTVEPGRPDSFQQRSPLIKIQAYSPPSCACMAGLMHPVCWQDYSLTPGTTYRYTVERIFGAPNAIDRERARGEIYSEGIPVDVVVP